MEKITLRGVIEFIVRCLIAIVIWIALCKATGYDETNASGWTAFLYGVAMAVILEILRWLFGKFK
jgi:low affinity Fe/Cu permease